MRPCFTSFCCAVVSVTLTLTLLIVVESTIASKSTSSIRDARLLPLKRQKQTIQHDLDLILPESTRPSSVFRERQRQLDRERYFSGKDNDDNEETKLIKLTRDPNSVFSERRRHQTLLHNNVDNRRNKMSRFRLQNVKNDDRKRVLSSNRNNNDQLEAKIRRSSVKRKFMMPENWDPRFPALNLPRKSKRPSDSDKETQINWREDENSYLEPEDKETVEALLRRVAWNQMNKRLILLNDDNGPYLDRGERRRRVQKRTSTINPIINEKELEDIMTDERDNNPVGNRQNKDGSPSKVTPVSTNEQKHDLPNDRTSKDGNSSKETQRTSKGKEWLPPIDSERTLRNKKSTWDDYFGVDKRGTHGPPIDSKREQLPEQEMNSKETDEITKDFLVKWYFEKMLSREQETRDYDDEDVDEEEDEEDENVSLKNVDERLRRIEDIILLKTTNLLEAVSSPIETTSDREEYIMEHLRAAFSLDKMRNDLNEFEQSLIKLKILDDSFDDDIDDNDDDKKKRKKKRKKSTPDGTSQKIPEEITDVVVPQAQIDIQDHGYVHRADDVITNLCPVWKEAVAYCDDLGQVIGDGGLALTRACVEHMTCHTCEAGPLSLSSSSSTCDRLYLNRVLDLCGDDFRCQAMAGAMRSVFLSEHDNFRRRNRAQCVRDQCLTEIIVRRIRA